MNVAQLKELIKDKPDTEQLIVIIYDKNEAEEHIENNLMCSGCQGDHDSHTIPDEKWSEIVSFMHADDVVWGQADEAFNYYVENYFNEMEKGKHEHSN